MSDRVPGCDRCSEPCGPGPRSQARAISAAEITINYSVAPVHTDLDFQIFKGRSKLEPYHDLIANIATADEASIGSFEYAVAKLGTPLILVLGHSKCGAVEATIEQIKGAASFPGHIPEITKALTPAVRAELDQPGDLLGNAVKQNVLLNVQKLKTARPILSKAVEEKKLRIGGGVYDLYTGRVEIVA